MHDFVDKSLACPRPLASLAVWGCYAARALWAKSGFQPVLPLCRRGNKALKIKGSELEKWDSNWCCVLTNGYTACILWLIGAGMMLTMAKMS